MKKELFIKYLQQECTGEEFERLVEWFRNESTSPQARKMVNEIWDEFEPEIIQGEKQRYNQILDRVHHQINIAENAERQKMQTKFRRKKLFNFMTRVAAVLFLPALFLLIYTNFLEKKQFSVNTNDLEIIAPAEALMKFDLGDGTHVWLNKGSRLKYPYRFRGGERKVFLSGEAYFEVAHNKKIPFLVETEYLTVKATGTSFNVSAYHDDGLMGTTLVEGKVLLLEKNSGKEVKSMAPNESVTFDTKTNRYSVETSDITKNVAWKEGLLVFRRDSINLVEKKLERWFNVDIEITNEKLRKYTYNGTFADESISQVLNLMALATPINFKIIPREKLPDGSYSRQKIQIGLQATR